MDDGWFMEATCHDVGIAGNCGPDCPVYLRGECDSPPEPYVYVCVDAAGEPALTEGKRYELVEVTCDNLLLVADDEGQRREFFRSRFELQMGDFSESCDEAWRVNAMETMRIAVRDSDKAFHLVWVEDKRESGRFKGPDDYPYVVIHGYGHGDGGWQEIFVSRKTLEQACADVDSLMHSWVVTGNESGDPRFEGYRDATFEGVESLGMDRSLGWVFSVLSVKEKDDGT